MCNYCLWYYSPSEGFFTTETIIKYCSTTEIIKVSVYIKYFELESSTTKPDDSAYIIRINNYKSTTQNGKNIIFDQPTWPKVGTHECTQKKY